MMKPMETEDSTVDLKNLNYRIANIEKDISELKGHIERIDEALSITRKTLSRTRESMLGCEARKRLTYPGGN